MPNDLHTPTATLVEEIKQLREQIAKQQMFIDMLKSEHIDLVNDNAKLYSTSVSLSKKNIKEIKNFGDGNLSRGIRNLLRAYKDLWEGKR